MHTVDRQAATSAGIRSFALFSYGFRPFFLLAGVSAALLVPAWICVYLHGAVPLPNLPPQYWHGHEMIFGFLGAAIAGFLLTAIPSWTGSRGFAGTPLILLVTLWLAGRVAMAGAAFLPAWLVIALELSFLPALCALLAPPLLRSTNRNTPMLLVLGVFWLADLAFIIAMRSNDSLLAQRALRLAIDIVLILVTVIGGRIVPAFTSSALRKHAGRRRSCRGDGSNHSSLRPWSRSPSSMSYGPIP